MQLIEVEKFINKVWETDKPYQKILLRSFKAFEQDMNFYLNKNIPELYAKDYIENGNFNNHMKLYPPEFVWGRTSKLPMYQKPAIVIGESHYFRHFYGFDTNCYITVDKVTSFVEVLHKNLEAVIDYVTPFGFNEDFGDEEE